MGERKRIALVDDDRDFLHMSRCLLESRGFDVSCYTDPHSAAAQIKVCVPDVIVTDLMMNKLDSGFVFIRVIRADRRLAGIPIVIVTAIGSRMGLDFAPRDAGDLKAMGADAFFSKPVDPADFIAKIEELAGERCRSEGT